MSRNVGGVVLAQADKFRDETLAAMGAVATGMELAAERISNREVSAKTGRDIVTTADVEVETAIRTLLHEQTGMPSVGEEHGGAAPADGSPYWLIDPICGTRNYASRIPLYAVNLALVEDGEVTIAAVGDMSTNSTVVAERGIGTWELRRGEIHRLEVAEDTRTIDFAEGSSTAHVRRQAADLARRIIAADRWDFRSFGTTLSLAYLAAGHISGYIVFSASAIHTAPGVLLAAEAGGKVTDLAGQPWQLDSTSVVAASPATHGELMELIAKDSPKK